MYYEDFKKYFVFACNRLYRKVKVLYNIDLEKYFFNGILMENGRIEFSFDRSIPSTMCEFETEYFILTEYELNLSNEQFDEYLKNISCL